MISNVTFSYYRPQTKFAKVMFLHLSVILFTRGCTWQGACVAGRGVRGGGRAWWEGFAWQGACMARGHAWQGAYMAGEGGMHGGGHAWWGVMHGGGA